jgi:RNA polymerase sigma factor (TIGR02999 family)
MLKAGEITALLGELRSGDRNAWDRLSECTYPDLRRIAETHLRSERPGHVLQATALVNEVWLKFLGLQRVEINDRIHFFSFCSRLMRQILVDHARRRVAHERTLALLEPGDAGVECTLDLDLALRKLEAVQPRAAQVVEMRYFGGMAVEEVAHALEVSPATVKRDWLTARAWLYSELHGDGSGFRALG